MLVLSRQKDESIMVGDNAYSLSTRLEAWVLVLEIAKVNPILGLGPSNYHWYTPLFPIRGYAVRFNSHNQYVDLIAQTGFLGLACFLWFFGAVGWLGWQLRDRVQGGFAQAYVYGALGGVVGTLASAALGDCGKMSPTFDSNVWLYNGSKCVAGSGSASITTYSLTEVTSTIEREGHFIR